jgi:putative DNA primase/helicase
MTSEVADYARHGLALVPVSHGSKGPRQEGWNRRDRAITDPEQAGRLTGNVGLAHAYCSPTPTMALDVDDIDSARAWLGGRGVELDQLLAAGDAVQIVSGKPGRAKLIYRLPQGPLPSVTMKGGDGHVLFELRCASRGGLTVQDVLPP